MSSSQLKTGPCFHPLWLSSSSSSSSSFFSVFINIWKKSSSSLSLLRPAVFWFFFPRLFDVDFIIGSKKKQNTAIRFEKCSVYSTFTRPERSLEIEISFKSEFWSKWEHNYIRGTSRTNTSTGRNGSLEGF